MKKQRLKKLNVITERVPVFEGLINDSKVLNSEEKENLIFSIKYIITTAIIVAIIRGGIATVRSFPLL